MYTFMYTLSGIILAFNVPFVGTMEYSDDQHTLIVHVPVLTAYFASKLLHCLQKGFLFWQVRVPY